MGELLRFGVSMENDLLARFDRLIGERGYGNRSEALRDLVRDALVQAAMAEHGDQTEVIGSLTLVYDHQARELAERMAGLQHTHHELVISVLHVHLSHDDCMEVIALRGRAGRVRALADGLLSLRGVKHGKLFLTLPAGRIAAPAKSRRRHDHGNR